MTPERLQHIRRVFESVLDLTSNERSLALLRTSDEDPSLASEVRDLLAAYEQRSDFLESPLLQLDSLSLDFTQESDEYATQPGSLIGPYRLICLLGEGGMGQIWRADQLTPVRRDVALKLVKAGMDTREVLARFESERQALALMNHPAIALVFDAGSTEQGRPYFVMELVTGFAITTYCDQSRLTVPERLRLFVRVCEGVQHAHQKAIIHRDLKPSNILVTEVDGRPCPKIIDFGIAKALSPSKSAEESYTRSGAILGTPEYMSPEQARSAGEDIDTRTDVFSLGVILYELMIGALPFAFQKRTSHQMLQRLHDADAPPPSSRFHGLANRSLIATQRRSWPALLRRQLKGDIDAIALKALELDRSRRYATPMEMAADVNRHLRNEPIAAGKANMMYHARKFARRHTGALVAAVCVGLLLILFAAVQTVQLRKTTLERDRAGRVTRFMTDMFKVLDPTGNHGARVTAREILDKASADVEHDLPNDPEMRARLMDVLGTVYFNLGLYRRSETLARETLEIDRRIFGGTALGSADAYDHLAKALRAQGRRKEAENFYEEAFAIRERELGPNHPDTLKSLSNRAGILSEERKFRQSEKLHREVYRKRSELLGKKHPDTLRSLDNLANVLSQEGRYSEAEALGKEAVALESSVFGGDHPETLHAIHHLANTFYSQRRFAEVEKLDRQVLESRKRLLGLEHRDTLSGTIALADTLKHEGHSAEAESLYRSTIEVQQRVLGPGHPDLMLAMSDLAGLLAEGHRLAEAEKLEREVLATRLRTVGPDSADTLSSMTRLGWILVTAGKLNEAEEVSRRARELQIKNLGLDHTDTADSTYNLACIAAQRGRIEEALKDLRSAVDHGLKPEEDLGVATEPLFAPLRADARFKELAAYARQRASRDKVG